MLKRFSSLTARFFSTALGGAALLVPLIGTLLSTRSVSSTESIKSGIRLISIPPDVIATFVHSRHYLLAILRLFFLDIDRTFHVLDRGLLQRLSLAQIALPRVQGAG